jgi:hypothetical protein
MSDGRHRGTGGSQERTSLYGCEKRPDLRHYADMGDRYRTADGWAVEVIGLSDTPDRNDGERLKVTYCGFFVALVRTVAELEQWFSPADLEPETLALAA